MFVTEVKLMQRRNLGNYEHKEAGITIALKEDDSFDEANYLARKRVESLLSDRVKTGIAAPKEAPAKKEAAPKEEAPAKKEAAPKEEAPAKKEAAPKEEAPAKKKAATKKAPAKKKAATKKALQEVEDTKEEEMEAVESDYAPTHEDAQAAMRKYAEVKKSAPMARDLMKKVTGKSKVKDLDTDSIKKLIKAIDSETK